jgi:hypothetical protein
VDRRRQNLRRPQGLHDLLHPPHLPLRRPAARPPHVITPAGFEGFFEGIGALTARQQQDIPRVLEIGKKYGLQFPPPRTA